MKEKKKRYNTNRFNNTLTDNKVLSYKLNHLTSLGQKKKKNYFILSRTKQFIRTNWYYQQDKVFPYFEISI